MTALAAGMGAGKTTPVIAEAAQTSTGFFGAHPFIEEHPEAVFIMFTHVDVKTNADANKREGMNFANEVITLSAAGLRTINKLGLDAAIKKAIGGGHLNEIRIIG